MMIMQEKDINAYGTNETIVLIVAHCILNQSTRWWQKGQPVERNQGPVNQILQFMSDNKIGAVQLPCPEFTFLGNPRSPATKDDYESLSGFKEHCRRLAMDSSRNLKSLIEMGRDPKIAVLAIIGVERSPSCGVKYTPRKVDGKTKYVEEKGIFFEALDKEMKNLGFKVPIIGLDMHQPEDLCRKLSELMRKAASEE
jgi:predicted secreted protein